MRDAIVTGGAGAIGSRLVARLLASGTHVWVVDDFSSGHDWLLPDRHTDLGVLRGDVADDSTWETFKPSGSHSDVVVYHLAAHFANQNSVDHPVDDAMTNAIGTLRALEFSAKIGARRFVYASAGCAAGHEDTPYQIHKRLGESYCRYFFDRVPSCIMRFHNSYGPGEVPGKYRNVIPNWIWKAMHGEELIVYGDGGDVRDFVYVEDVVTDLIEARPGLAPQEIGTGVATSARDLIEAILVATERNGSWSFKPSRRWDHHGAPAAYVARPRMPLREGLRETVKWFRENESRIAKCVS